MGAGRIFSPGNDPHSFRIYGQIYNLVPPNEAYKSGYGLLYILHSAEVTIKCPENQSHQECVVEAMQ
jgi:hypothetical protein